MVVPSLYIAPPPPRTYLLRLNSVAPITLLQMSRSVTIPMTAEPSLALAEFDTIAALSRSSRNFCARNGIDAVGATTGKLDPVAEAVDAALALVLDMLQR